MPETTPPRLDLSELHFPSDRVTVGQLREELPELFTEDSLNTRSLGCLNVAATIKIEIRLAEAAFAKALGLPEPPREQSQADRFYFLNDDYKRYGLSSGMQMTRQLVREIEKAAVEQAKKYRAR